MPFTSSKSDKIVESAHFAGFADFFLTLLSGGIQPARNTCNAINKDLAKCLCN